MKTPHAPSLSSPSTGRRVSRFQLEKLKRSTSTKSERQVAEILKKNRIHFRAQVRVGIYEVDFIIGRVALEVDGSVHKEINSSKDTYLFSKGYVPLHIRSSSVKSSIVVKQLLDLIYQNNVYN